MAPNSNSVESRIQISGSPVPPKAIEGKKRKEILYENFYYDVTDWAKIHPGGKIIEFYAESGEDATIPIRQFHNRSSKKVMGLMNSLTKRPSNDNETGLDEETLKRHSALTKDFIELHNQLEAEGAFRPSLFHIAYRIFELVAMETIGVLLLLHTGNSLTCNIIGILLVALCHGRFGFLGHDCGHRAFTGNRRVDKFFEMISLGFGVGLSASWWTSAHHRHHAFPNRVKRDADLQTLPLVAFNAKVVKDSKQGKSFFVQNQALLFFPIDTMLASIAIRHVGSPRSAFLKRRYGELLVLASHHVYAWYFLGFWPSFFIAWLAAVYLLGNFALSHTHLPVTTTGNLHWVEYALHHTTDIEPSWLAGWWMGWLNYQIEHHLFPTIPHFRLHSVRGRVQKLAARHGIPYHCVPYWTAVRQTLVNLKEVSKELE